MLFQMQLSTKNVDKKYLKRSNESHYLDTYQHINTMWISLKNHCG